VIGAHYSVEETFRIIEKDVIFYRNSGGGVTLGGGDPLLQADFARRLLAKCKETNIRTAMETSAYAPWSALSGVCRLTDEIFVDIKHIDPQRHRELTGFSNEPVLENIAKLAAVHPGVVVRYPLIPGCNDGEEDIKGLAAWVRKNLRNPYVELSPYHCLGTHKYRQLWRDYALAETREPSAEQVGNTVGLLGTLGVDSKSLH
jgi:pyruvate formate lyase activating enzyme